MFLQLGAWADTSFLFMFIISSKRFSKLEGTAFPTESMASTERTAKVHFIMSELDRESSTR